MILIPTPEPFQHFSDEIKEMVSHQVRRYRKHWNERTVYYILPYTRIYFGAFIVGEEELAEDWEGLE